MADKAGIGVSTWANLENGHQNRASATLLQRVARALRLELAEVIATSGGSSGETTHPEPTHPPNKKRGLQRTALAS